MNHVEVALTKTKCLTYLTAALVALGLRSTAHAALRAWSGLGADPKWSTATNWVGGVAPSPGDDLFFPPGTAQNNANNDFPSGTTFNSLIFAGGFYSLGGSSVALNAGILATNGISNTINNLLIFNSNQTFTIHVGSASFNLSGAIDTNGKDLTFDMGASSLAQVQAVISGAGGLVKTGAGNALLYASNTFSGPVQVLQGGLSIYNGHALGDTNGNTTVSDGAVLTFAGSPLTVPEPLVLAGSLNTGAGAKLLTGPLTLEGSNAAIQLASGAPLTINAVISGSGGFSKNFAELLTLNSNNTYSGTTTVSSGTLLVNGSQPASPIVLNSSAALNSATLGGAGTVGTITSSGSFSKAIAPGNYGPGILTASNLVLDALTIFAVELNGTNAGSGYDQLKVSGSVTLSNAALSATLGFASVISNRFVIIDNDGADPVIGTFSGLPEGATLNLNGTPFRVSYAGGDGNDVVLTQLTDRQRPTLNIQPDSGTNVVLLWATNFTGFALEANTNLSTNVWATVIPSPTVTGANYVVTNVASGLQKYYRLR